MKTDLEFIQYLVHLDWNEFTDWEVIDMIDAYCNLRGTFWPIIAQDEFCKTYEIIQ